MAQTFVPGIGFVDTDDPLMAGNVSLDVSDRQKQELGLPGPWQTAPPIMQVAQQNRAEQRLGGARSAPLQMVQDVYNFVQDINNLEGGTHPILIDNQLKEMREALAGKYFNNPESVQQFYQILYEMYGDDPAVAKAMTWDSELPDFDDWAKDMGLPIPEDEKAIGLDTIVSGLAQHLSQKYGKDTQSILTKGFQVTDEEMGDFTDILPQGQDGPDATQAGQDQQQFDPFGINQPSAINPPQMQPNIWQDEESGQYMQGNVTFNPETGEFEPVGAGMPIWGENKQVGRGFFKEDPLTGDISPNYIPPAPSGFQEGFTGPGGYNWTWDKIAGQAIQGGYDPLKDLQQQNWMKQFEEAQRATLQGEALSQTREDRARAQMQMEADQWRAMHPDIAKGWLADSYGVAEGTQIGAGAPVKALNQYDYEKLNPAKRSITEWMTQIGATPRAFKPQQRTGGARVSPTGSAFRR